ncbi:hypothetical protein RGQ15_17375 [Paracoccus sp. MBLB3053]|uniref:Membrane-anchored protein n=1 Tax=Paracoccus aurantius TaxID=3073814 RepID=A0ABU2HWA2_9RHOB|nr:hypothetical protein [Paracoccus sp. MBLB3053]MDS9469336.1 hypothetical protein [Paracoccus sp. MBLB3053]
MPFLDSVARRKRFLYRYIKYHVLRPPVPEQKALLRGKTAVVVGSAPGSHRPVGWNESFRVITVNASQVAAADWLSDVPDITLMQFNQIEGENPSALEVRRVLRGRRTGSLILINWRHDLQRLKNGLARFDYGYDRLLTMSRYERIALMERCLGKLNLELDASTKWSNGVVGVALALQSGARRVILTGIDPCSAGHGYNDLRMTRLHATTDLEALTLLRDAGLPIFTADPAVSERTGLALWAG